MLFRSLAKNESFLGYGFDVIRSSVFSDKYIIISNPIFKSEDLMNQRLVKVDSKVTYVDEVQSYSIEEFMEQWNAQANVNVSWGKKRVGGSVAIDTAYSGGVEGAASKYFHCISFNNQKFYIVLQSDIDSYRQMLTDGFKKDLYSNMEPSKLFELYGTHFITSAVMGGRINSYYLYSSEEQVNYHDVSAAVSTEVRYLAGKTNVDVDGGYRSIAEKQNVSVKNTFEVIGGGDFGMNSDEDIAEHYSDWEKSLDNKASLIGIKDSGSLRAVWELIDPALDTETYTWEYPTEAKDEDGNAIVISGSGNRAAQLRAYFEAYGVESYNSLMEAAELPGVVVVEDIDSITVNGEGANDDGYFSVLVGGVNKIDFAPVPANATNVNKTVSLLTKTPYARIDSLGRLVIDEGIENDTVLLVSVSAGRITKKIKILVSENYTVDFVTNISDFSIEAMEDVDHGTKISAPELPERSGYELVGWYKDAKFTSPYDFEADSVKSNLTLYAQWMCIKDVWKVEKPNGNRDKTITDAGVEIPTYTEIVNFSNIDVAQLIENGKKKVKLTIEFGMHENDNGNQELFFYKVDNEKKNETPLISREHLLQESPCLGCVQYEYSAESPYVFVLKTGNEVKEDGWHTHVFVFEFNTEELLNSYSEFKIGYGANGEGEDDWRLGHTIITVEFY